MTIVYPVRASGDSCPLGGIVDAVGHVLGTIETRDALNEGHRSYDDDVRTANKALLETVGQRVDDLIMETARVAGCSAAFVAVGVAVAVQAVVMRSSLDDREDYYAKFGAALDAMKALAESR